MLPFLVIFIFVSISFIVTFLKSIVDLYSKKDDKMLVAFISIIFLSITIIFHFNFPYETTKICVEWNKFEKARNEVVELVKRDKLAFIGDTKTAVLPNKLKKISQTGEIVVYLNEDKKQVIGFFINRGMLSGSKMLIYSNCGKKLINEKEKNAVNIKKIKEKWYYVETE